MPLALTVPSPLHIAFGAVGLFDAGVPVLVGDRVENLFSSARPAGRSGSLEVFQTDEWLLGAATVPLTGGLEEAARRLYGDILAAIRVHHLARIWNYVPDINAAGPDGMENYRAFCRGRSLAFEQHFGRDFHTLLPSASAVGRSPGGLTVAFAACRSRPRHVENPLQVAAYDYPGEYGPRAPSFARATVAPDAAMGTVFISGTAAIRGHASIAPGRLPEQLACTLENLRGISRACGLGPNLDRGGVSARHFKVYVRHAPDQAEAARLLEAEFFVPGDTVAYLQAGICRASLLVEIEASLFGVTYLR